MPFKKYNENFLGIVVQNNDPEFRGRIKVFVPHISATVYKKWNEVKKDKRFKFVGKNISSDLSDILDDLKMILPWAECAAPLVGENASGRYNHNKRAATISDTNKSSSFVSNLSSVDINPALLTKYSQNLDAIGEKLGNKYDIDFYKLHDAFVTPLSSAINNVNKFSYNYVPETLSNQAKGSFAVPNVGSHVWVFYEAGDPMKPVYFATSFGTEDWKGIYNAQGNKGIDYPGKFENTSLSGKDTDINIETYRNKYVVNQKGGSIQIVNTDNREALKFTHFSGSFKEFTNLVNIELATNNDQKLVLGDLFETVRGDKNTFVQSDHDNIVEGNSYIKIGNLKSDPFVKWKDLYSEIAHLKQLFDIKRTNKYGPDALKLTSPLQNKNGSPASCPVCRGGSYYWTLNNLTGTVGIPFTTRQMGDGTFFNGNISIPLTQEGAQFVTNTTPLFGQIFGSTCPSCGGTGLSKSSMNGTWAPEGLKNTIEAIMNSKITAFADLEKQMGLGGSQIIDITKHKFETIGMVMNDFGSIRVDPVGKMYNAELVIHQDGVFANKVPTPLIEYAQIDDMPSGNYTLNVCNKYTVQVGAGGLILKSFGPVNISGTITNIAGAQVNIGSQNEVNIDGGQRLNIIADVISIKQRNKRQVLIDSSLGVNKNVIIGGGLHVEGELFVNHITAPGEIQLTDTTVAFAGPSKDLTGMGSCLGYGSPLMFYEDQDGVPIGVPAIIGITQPGAWIGNCVIGSGSSAGVWPVYGNGLPCIQGSYMGYGGFNTFGMPIKNYGTGSDDDSITIAPHRHTFKNIPLTLADGNQELRDLASINNNQERTPPDSIANGQK